SLSNAFDACALLGKIAVNWTSTDAAGPDALST
ncbi:unnamed protein product, partial [marine sediment metagenome]